MKNKLLALLLALTLLAGCGGPQADTDATVTAAFEELLAADYQVYYMIYGDGLEMDLDARTEDYAPVTTQGYTTRAGLEQRLKEVYALDETVKSLLSARDENGRDRFQVRNGALWRAADAFAYPYETREGSIVLTSRSDGSASFVFEETGLDGSLYETSLAMSKTSRGWRLNGTRRDAQRTLLREGSGVDSVVSTGAARNAAEAFLAALENQDLTALGKLLGAGNELTMWEKIRIISAEIVSAAEDLDSQGDYTVRVTVEDGAGVYPEGTWDFRLVLACDMMRWGEEVVPVYFRPVWESYYNWADSAAAAQEKDRPGWYVSAFIGFYGPVTFQSPEDLPAETVAECSMMLVEPQSSDLVYTPEEFSAAVEKCFGLADFDGRGTPFYSKEQNGYLLWGRGGNTYDTLIGMPQTANGQSQVEVTFCRDALCTRKLRTIRYTLADNGDGSWRFLSAVQIEE